MIDDGAASIGLSIEKLIEQFEHERFYQDNRAAAECAYALAVRLREAGRLGDARRYARACLRLAEELPSTAVDDVASTRQAVGGVPLPDYFHDGVVRVRLADLLAGHEPSPHADHPPTGRCVPKPRTPVRPADENPQHSAAKSS
ncbi:hypothetical protein JNW90_15815 [Micromonospora sp. STR1s_5]|nr:hypothetical protein [Micromonospora sp. STR1s_5]